MNPAARGSGAQSSAAGADLVRPGAWRREVGLQRLDRQPDLWRLLGAATSNARDGIFADSLASELATVTGSPAAGYTAAFTVGVSL